MYLFVIRTIKKLGAKTLLKQNEGQEGGQQSLPDHHAFSGTETQTTGNEGNDQVIPSDVIELNIR